MSPCAKAPAPTIATFGHGDVAGLGDALRMDYNGWIVVEGEQDPAKAPPFAHAKIDFEHITEICGRSGLTIEK